MISRKGRTVGIVFFTVLAIVICSSGKEEIKQVGTSKYQDLVSLFVQWREFQKPKIIEGVPDYSAAAMKEQFRGLKNLQARLASIDCSRWPVSQQIDYHLVRAEMNGLEFEHRVLRPWSRDPCFYAVINDSEPDVPAREEPEMYGCLQLWRLKFPLPEKDVADFRMKLQLIPKILEQARKNLTEDAKDLWFLGIRAKQKEIAILDDLAKTLAVHHPDLVAVIEKAKTSVEEFRLWLEKRQRQMKAPSGVGIENFNWYMKNVHLVPYSWQEQATIVEHEWERAMASLKLEEHRNRNLPKLEPPANDAEIQRRYNEAMNVLMDFIHDEQIFTVPDYFQFNLYRESFIPLNLRNFFTQIEYHDSLPMKCHFIIHSLDKQRMIHDPHPSPIRNGPLLYSIWDSRAEGLATAMEEMMMQAGLFNERPRARELIYILLAMRAARAMGDLKMHSGEFSLEDAVKFAIDQTPYGWLLREGDTVWTDMRIYLHQPGYGTSYLIGKIQIDKLLADRSEQLDRKFRLHRFMDDLFASGMIPVSLIRWEITGKDDEVNKLWHVGASSLER
jgi:hypothetical protein